MQGCFHLPGVYCDNCRTGLEGYGAHRYYTVGVIPAPVSCNEVHLLRLELEVAQLREEIARITKLFEDAIGTHTTN